MKAKPLYIETEICCSPETLWEHTQNPHLHQQWDLRFSHIDYLPKNKPSSPQEFRYSTNIGFGLQLSGTGKSAATKASACGESTSALKFSSDNPWSLIRTGAGYWKYRTQGNANIFCTGYQYKTRWGLAGKLLDQYLFRPLMKWATAWSFDRLKIWLEKGIRPQQALQSQLTVWLCHALLALVWIYQGLLPKLLFPHSGEVAIVAQSGFFDGYELKVVKLIGSLEVIFGLCLLLFNNRRLHYLNILLLCFLGFGAAFSRPEIMIAPFNPFSLNLALIGLSCTSLLHLRNLPKASHCKTQRL